MASNAEGITAVHDISKINHEGTNRGRVFVLPSRKKRGYDFDFDDRFAEFDRLGDRIVTTSQAELVKLRYFVGMTADQAAAELGISPSTSDRHWAYARAWIKRFLTD